MANEAILIKRLGSFHNKPRPILVECKFRANILTILKEEKKTTPIRELENIFIIMDTTAYQRQITNNLQNELNQKRASGDDS